MREEILADVLFLMANQDEIADALTVLRAGAMSPYDLRGKIAAAVKAPGSILDLPANLRAAAGEK